MHLHYLLAAFLGAYAKYTWVFHGIIIFTIASLVSWFKRWLFRYLLIRFEKTSRVWDDALICASSLPMTLFIWSSALTLFVQFLLLDLRLNDWSNEMMRTRIITAILLFIWFCWRYINQIEYRLLHKNGLYSKSLDKTTVSVVGRIWRVLLLAVAALILLNALGIPLAGVLAFGGGGALAMGIAAQHFLANWFGGLMIFWDKPFKINDWIASPDRNIEGRVVEIGWRSTKIISPDNRPLYVPNSIFSQAIIANATRITHRKIEATIGLRYCDAGVIKAIVKSIELLLKSLPTVDLDERFMVHFTSFGESKLNIHLLCCIREVDINAWRTVQQDVFLKIIDIVAEHKAEFAYPTVTQYSMESEN